MFNDSVFPGGTNTPDHRRAHSPHSLTGGEGAYVYTNQGEELIDLSMGYGAQIFGHGNPEIASPVSDSIERGWLFAEPHSLVEQVGEQIIDFFPSADTVKLATTGSDAVTYSLRCARSFTGRDKILATEGGYHGVHDGLTYSGGFLDEVANSITKVPFNDVEALKSELTGRDYAAFLLEPVLKDSGCIEPSIDYLEQVREICTETGTILIFDEVLTGARLGPGGAQAKYDVIPDLMTASKALSAGFPLSAVAGKEAPMTEFLPAGDVFLAGTFNANPPALTATKTTLKRLNSEPVHERINALGTELREFLSAEFADREIEATVQGVGSISSIALGHEGTMYTQRLHNQEYSPDEYYDLAVAARDAGLLFPPYHFQCMFMAEAHQKHIDEIKSRFCEALNKFQEE